MLKPWGGGQPWLHAEDSAGSLPPEPGPPSRRLCAPSSSAGRSPRLICLPDACSWWFCFVPSWSCFPVSAVSCPALDSESDPCRSPQPQAFYSGFVLAVRPPCSPPDAQQPRPWWIRTRVLSLAHLSRHISPPCPTLFVDTIFFIPLILSLTTFNSRKRGRQF